MSTRAQPWTPCRRVARLLASAAAVLATATPAAGAARAATDQAPPATAALEMREFRFQPNDTEVPAGQPVELTLFNAGVIPHDLMIMAPGMPPTILLNPGQRRTIQVQFANPGVYVVMCSIAGHAEAGMKGTVRAVAPLPSMPFVGAVSLDPADGSSSTTATTPSAAAGAEATGDSSGQSDSDGAASPPVPATPDDGTGGG